MEWNALKLLNDKGEFISAQDGAIILEKAKIENFSFATAEKIGRYSANNSYLQNHITAVLNHPMVDISSISQKTL